MEGERAVFVKRIETSGNLESELETTRLLFAIFANFAGFWWLVPWWAGMEARRSYWIGLVKKVRSPLSILVIDFTVQRFFVFFPPFSWYG